MTTKTYFGTDGVRGVAGHEPLTGEFAFRVGAAAAVDVMSSAQTSARPAIAIGMDTRQSGPMLAHAVAAGIASRGVDAIWLGVMPTPGVSYLTRTLGASAGIAISASHNPFEDNGIKLFDASGVKYSDTAERRLEGNLEAEHPPVVGGQIGTSRRYRFENADYIEFLLANAPYLDGLRVGLDCANGAASVIAPRLFAKMGARLDLIHAAPDGTNINRGCGSTHPETIRSRVMTHDLDVGIAFDGDADRALLVDRKGRIVTGDHMLAICARSRGDEAVVATVMTNLGVERHLAEHGIELHRVQVGDRYVHQELTERGLELGGEQSGHVLFLDKAPTGDGMLTALQVLSAVRKSSRTLDAWMDEIPLFPQTLVNVRVTPEHKHGVVGDPAVISAVAEATTMLGDRGRINVRASGTEPLVRVMVEGEDLAEIEKLAQRVVESVKAAAGSAAA